jgi:hypothetical protein
MIHLAAVLAVAISGGVAIAPPVAGGEADAASVAAPVEAVEVTGRGPDLQSALDDGVQSALLRVAGAYVKAETVVVDDELVSQRLRTHAKGIVERIERKGEAVVVDGVYAQPMVVHVRRAPFVEVMKEAVKASRDIDGESLSARVRALKSRDASAVELVAELRRGFPASVLGVTVSEPREVEVPEAGVRDDEACLLVLVDVAIDDAKWKTWATEAGQVLESIANQTVEIDWNPRQAGSARLAKDALFPADTQSEAASVQAALSASTGEPRHQDVFSMLAERLRAQAADATRPGSPWVGLLASRGGKVRFFSLPAAVHRASWGMDGGPAAPVVPSRAPGLQVRLVDAGGDSLGRIVPLGATDPGTGTLLAARRAAGRGFGPALPVAAATPEFRLPASYFLPSVTMPWLSCRDNRGTVAMLERLTIPVLFVVDRGSIPSIRKVEASLTEATFPWVVP